MVGVLSTLKAWSGGKIDHNVQAFLDLMITPTIRGFKCEQCGTVSKKVRGEVGIRIPSTDSPTLNVEHWMKSIFHIPNMYTRLRDSQLVCPSCSHIQLSRRETILYYAHRVPQILTLRFDIPPPRGGNPTNLSADNTPSNSGSRTSAPFYGRTTVPHRIVEFSTILDLTPYCRPGKERILKYALSGIVVMVSSNPCCALENPTDKFISYVRERRVYHHHGEEEQEEREEYCWLKFDEGEPVVRLDESQVWEDSQGVDNNGSINCIHVLIYERLN